MTVCPRRFEAEAIRDGRLGDAERASFERHLRACSECAHETRALSDLAAALGEAIHRDELSVRRERTRLLGAFDETLTTPRRSSRMALLAAAALILLAVAAFATRRRPSAPPSVAAVVPLTADIQPDSDAVWSRPSAREIVLERGALRVHVVHGPLVVRLPDGELEDTGTTFIVTAEGERTTRVAVEEGSVVLRLHGAPQIRISAGETWSPPPPVASAPASSPPPKARLVPVSTEFRDAMALLDAGRATEAASAFARFVAKHPDDSRAEDAAYLRVIALQRAGNDSATKAAAREYLNRYPAGFRRVEVEALAP